MAQASPAPSSSPGPVVERHPLVDDGTFPNNRLPLLVLRGAMAGADGDAVQTRFAAHGWSGAWRGGIYTFHHYHSTSHEVLGCYAGQASVRLGGPTDKGITATLRAGDVLVIPAGVAHCNLGASADFAVVGAYPEGRRWDLLRGERGDRPGRRRADRRVARAGGGPGERGGRGAAPGVEVNGKISANPCAAVVTR